MKQRIFGWFAIFVGLSGTVTLILLDRAYRHGLLVINYAEIIALALILLVACAIFVQRAAYILQLVRILIRIKNRRKD